jgi:iron complex transport system substrate-binding protein
MAYHRGVRLRIGSILFLTGWWLFLVAAPGEGALLRDMLGQPVLVPDRPLRVVSLAPSLTETAFALGRGEWLVGVTDFCDYPPAAKWKPKVGGIVSPNLEEIVRLNPDLVLMTAEGNPREIPAQLARLGIPAFALKPDRFTGLLESIEILGRVLQAEPVAADVVGRIRKQVQAVRSSEAGGRRPDVLMLIWSNPLIAAGRESYLHDLLELAGGRNVVSERGIAYPRLDWEQVIAAAPEVIIVADHRAGEQAPVRRAGIPPEWRIWRAVPAIREGRVVSVPANIILRPGPRVDEGLAALKEAIYRESGWRMGAR